MTSPLISIIVPVYNAAPYVEKCLRSLVAQDYENTEIIVVDDGSSDGSGDIVAQLGLDKVQLIRQPNGGVSRARNTGIRAAQGEYILFVDGDDWVDTTHISSFMNYLHSNLCCVMNVMSRELEDGTPQFPDVISDGSIERFSKNQIYQLFDRHEMSSPCEILYNRQIIVSNNVWFDEKISFAEDLDFNLRYFKYVDDFVRVKLGTYHYIKHFTSAIFRYHNNTTYSVLTLCDNAKDMISGGSRNWRHIFQIHFTWAIINLFHKDCPLSPQNVCGELGLIFSSKAFRDSLPALKLIPINGLLKLIIRMKSPKLLYYAFKVRNHK